MPMILQLNSVYKNYYRGKTEVPVLKDINLQVSEGEYLAIMGPSGSGKTTLMNLIGCLDVPTSGEYILDGRKINELDDNALADIRNRQIGFVFQNFHLLPKMNALDNVALPLLYAGVSPKERKARAAEALKMVGLEERMNFLPNQLSGGQCQAAAGGRTHRRTGHGLRQSGYGNFPAAQRSGYDHPHDHPRTIHRRLCG